MKQGSAEWLEWRRSHVGASDQTHLHWSAPWSIGWQKLWDIKKGLAPELPINQHMERGIRLEKDARLAYILETGIEVEPTLVTSQLSPFMAASLDGYNEEKSRAVEIKCAGPDDHALAIKGEIPKKYLPQLAHQALVTGAQVDYCSYDGKNIVVLKFGPTKRLLDLVHDSALLFYKFMQENQRPPGEYPHPEFDTRIPEITDPEAIVEAVTNSNLRGEIEKLTEELEKSNERLLSKIKETRAKILDLQIITRVTPGRIKYDDIPELSKMDLEKYRGKEKVSRFIIKK